MQPNFYMMKKLLVLAIAALISTNISAQTDTLKDKKKEEEKVEVVRDRLVFDIFHTFWIGEPAHGEFNKFNPGFNVSAMWDFKVPQSKFVSFGLGVGFTFHTQYSNCILMYNKSADISKYYIIPSAVDFKRSKVAYMNCNIPIEIRFRHKCGFKFDLGAHIGIVAGLSQNYKGNNYNGEEGEYLNRKDRNFYNKEKFSAEVFVRTGWKSFGIYYSYQITKVFKDNKGPLMHPMTLGISISLF